MDSSNNMLIGKAPEFQSIINASRLVAVTDVAVLIVGESGTGKELMARAIHQGSRRAAKPFVAINCAALAETLVESELFGHRKGAFTGADRDHGGRIRAADGGTLFLDEIGELPLAVQAKLLRFLESGECQAVGETMPRKVDVRVIAATNRDLFALAKQGGFREDLYYRLNVVPLEMPPLRRRGEDIIPLLQHLTAQLAGSYGLAAPVYSRDAIQALTDYAWPGNVRELRNLCERMLVLFPGKPVTRDNLPLEIRSPRTASQGDAGLFKLPETGLRLEELERQMIEQALHKAGGNRSHAARLLGLSRDTLLYRIKKYAIPCVV